MFIRTKKGIYELQAITISSYEKLVNTKVIKQADTIEELCDEYVCCKDIIFESELDDYIATGNIVYGAIWTSKGLIYVAKMNDKGELELL